MSEHATPMRAKLALGVLVVTNALTLLALGYARLEIRQTTGEIRQWERLVMRFMTVPYAMYWAKEDFQKGKRQLYVCEWLQDEPNEMTTEEDIGQFEIITWPSDPLGGRPARKAWEVIVRVYNSKMRQFVKQSEEVPDNEDHRSQPEGST